MAGTIDKYAVSGLVRCINNNGLYASAEETAAWLKTPDGKRIQQLINELRAKDKKEKPPPKGRQER